MDRKNFLKNSALTVLSVSAFGSIKWTGGRFEGNTPTTTDLLGPFYRPGAPMRTDLRQPDSTGEPLSVFGNVYKIDGKTPLSDALVEIWHCDENQHYDNTSDTYLYRGATKTGKIGEYRFNTIMPVPYEASPGNWRPAHIHFRISSPNQQDLITQIYFVGDSNITTDGSASSPQSIHRILDVQTEKNGNKAVRFDIVMQDEFLPGNDVYKRITGLYQMDAGIAEFTRKDDLLYLKLNGQYMEGLSYKGNNTFTGGLNFASAEFELLPDGGAGVKISIGDFTNLKTGKVTVTKGKKFMKYSD